MRILRRHVLHVLIGCALTLGLVSVVGCQSATLAKDEAAAIAVLHKIEGYATDPTTVPKIQTAADELLAIDPNSAFLQKTTAAIKKEATAGNAAKVAVIAGGGAAVLAAIAPVTT